MMDSSPSKMNTLPPLPKVAGVKRPAPTLLPAFEPFSSSSVPSSPGLPRPSKRQARQSPSQREAAYQKYPTPIPTSTTGIISSSPPQVHVRPGFRRTQSTISQRERAPLAAVPSITLPENGEPLLMGRSSNSSHYQLSANRLISRIHIKARYIAATTPLEPNKVEIVCCGWNGFKLHCQGRTWDLSKGDSFTSETECAEIMLDVQDARVRVAWPESSRKDSVGTDALWDDDSNSSLGRASASNSRGQLIESSPMRRHSRLESPVSPTPVRTSGQTLLNLDLVQESSPEPLSASLPGPSVHIYEDESADVDDNIAAGNSMISTVAATSFQVPSSPPSDLSDPEDAHDPDEENDPVVHSFGPFGADISSRMASFTAVGSPEAPRNRSFRDLSKLSPLAGASSKPTNEVEALPIVNHVANQLAFSRLSSTPLSVIMDNLPTDLKGALTKAGLRQMLHGAVCIGEIPREGKDAAGKALESEYYYKPDEDTDAGRRAAVVDGLRKPSLRNCRKQHKQYYWKKPKTP